MENKLHPVNIARMKFFVQTLTSAMFLPKCCWSQGCVITSHGFIYLWLLVNAKFNADLGNRLMKEVHAIRLYFKHTEFYQKLYYEQALIKTINVRGPSFIGLTWSLSLLLMPWLLTSPGHQHPWLCRIGKSLSYLRNDSNYLCYIIVE